MTESSTTAARTGPAPIVHRVDIARLENAGPEERIVERIIDHATGSGTCTVSAIRTPPGKGSPEGFHTHREDQIFYIVAGTMSIEIEDRRYEAEPGTIVYFPAGVPHRNWVDGDEATVHLVINAPTPDPSVPFAIPADPSG